MPKYIPTVESEERLATKTRYSPSRMLSYLKCPAHYAYNYLTPKEESLQPVNLFMGSCVHQVVEMAMAHKIVTGSLPPLDDLYGMHEELWHEADGNVVENEVGDLKNSQRMAQSMIGVFMRDRAPLIDPIETESEWYLELPGRSYYIHGIIDLVAAHKPKHALEFTDSKGKTYDEASLHTIFTRDAGSTLADAASEKGLLLHTHSNTVRQKQIRDLKTIARTPGLDLITPNNYQISPDYDFQLRWYATMVTEGRHDIPVCLDYVTKQAAPKAVEAATTIKASQIPLMLNTIDMIHKAAETKIYYPNRASKFCGTNCDFWEVCHQQHG